MHVHIYIKGLCVLKFIIVKTGPVKKWRIMREILLNMIVLTKFYVCTYILKVLCILKYIIVQPGVYKVVSTRVYI